jgi:hypothetical protein
VTTNHSSSPAAIPKLLLIFVPAAILLSFLLPSSHMLIFLAACLAIVPLAGWLGRATEQLAHNTNEGIGGLLNATFGNATELIIAVAAPFFAEMHEHMNCSAIVSFAIDNDVEMHKPQIVYLLVRLLTSKP